MTCSALPPSSRRLEFPSNEREEEEEETKLLLSVDAGVLVDPSYERQCQALHESKLLLSVVAGVLVDPTYEGQRRAIRQLGSVSETGGLLLGGPHGPVSDDLPQSWLHLYHSLR